jgi:hypothetical protein
VAQQFRSKVALQERPLIRTEYRHTNAAIPGMAGSGT